MRCMANPGTSLLLAVLIGLTLGVGSAARAQGERFALVVGSNRGLIEEEQLRYAERDASKMKRALLDVGGFSEANVTELLGANAESLHAALKQLKSRMAGGPHDRLVVYVSSHAAEGALHLAGTELMLEELVEFVKAAPVRVGLLVIDACQSGRLTRLKGLKPADGPATRIEASGVEGRVLISSSGADEYAQESDSLEGSYFTHYLVTGLRGAADSSRDGQVTLDEAYAWAWARTIEATFASRGGVQRPSFSVDLRGAGQLVMAEPRKSASRLELDVEAPGRWLVVAEASGRIFADVDKAEGPLVLALPGGVYRLELRVGEAVLERTVTVPAQGLLTVSDGDFERTSLVRVARKGGQGTRLGLSASGGVASGLVAGLGLEGGAELRLRRDGLVGGPFNQLVATFGWRGGRSQTAAFRHDELELRLGVGHRFAWERWSLALDVETGPLLAFQSDLPDGSGRTSLGLAMCVALEARLKLVGPLEAFAVGTGGGAVVKKLSGTTLVPRLAASLGLVFVF